VRRFTSEFRLNARMRGHSTDDDWHRWFDEHGAKLWLFARQKARSEMDAEDLMQEAILEAAKRVKALPDPRLVFALIHRRAIDMARREHRRATREEAVAEGTPAAWFDVSSEDRERVRIVQEALARLPEDYREVITLKIWGDLTFAEIAETLGVPPNTAASRYRYGLAELRQATKGVLI
jgi:RNA polymerase sigma-70 factor, ECF subfamily